MNFKRSFPGTILQSKYFIPVCAVFSILCRIGWVCFVRPEPVADAKWYYERALGLAAGNGYVIDGQATAFWPVGYPAFLAAIFSIFGASLTIARLANVVLYLGILLVSYFLAKRLFRSEQVARLTFFGLAFYPNHIVYSSVILSETLFLFLSLSGVALLIYAEGRTGVEIAAGIVFGLACLVKPVIILLPGALYLAIMLRDRQRFQQLAISKAISLLIVYSALAVTLTPWIIRNYKVFDSFGLVSSNGGYNLLQGNNAYAYGSRAPFDKVDEILQAAETTYPEYQSNSGNLPPSKAQEEWRVDRLSRKVAIAYILGNPLEVMKKLPMKFFHLYKDDAEGLEWNIWGINERPFPLYIKALWKILTPVCKISYWLVWVLMLGGFAVLWKGRKRMPDNVNPGIGIWVIVYFTCIYLVFYGETRYHFPLIPWFVMYASVTIDALLRKWSVSEEAIAPELYVTSVSPV
jgi:4-amino-4-deoxy-L-arabinose transferase-like glycosyltransferase